MKNYNKHLTELNQLVREIESTLNIAAQGFKNSDHEIFQRSRNVINVFNTIRKDLNAPEKQRYNSMNSNVNSQIQASPTQEKIWQWLQFIKEILRDSDTSLLIIRPSNFDGILFQYDECIIRMSGTAVAIIESRIKTNTIEELLENSHFKFAIDSLIKKYDFKVVKNIEINSNEIFVFGDNISKHYDANSFKETVMIGVDKIIELKKTNNKEKKKYSSIDKNKKKSKVTNNDASLDIHLSDEGSPQRVGENVNPVIGAIELSKEIANILIEMNDNKGSIFGIFGRWGRGKTFLIDRIKGEENIKEQFEIVDFNAWKYQDTPASWAYLYEEIVKKYYEPPEKIINYKGEQKILCWLIEIINRNKFIFKFFSWFDCGYKCIKINIEKFGLFTPSIIFILIGLNIIWILLIPFMWKLSLFFIILGIITIDFIVLLIQIIYIRFKYKKTALQIFKKYTQKQDYIKYLGLQHEIQKEIKALLKVWFKNNNKKLLLIVEDIDRCPEERIIQIVDSLRVLLEDTDIYKKIVIVIAIDDRILKTAIRHKYLKLKKNDKDIEIDKIISEYMDKLFLCGISLCSLTNDEKKKILSTLTENRLIMRNGETKIEKVQRTNTKNVESDVSSRNKKLTSETKENNKIKVAKNQLTEKELDAIIGIVNNIKNATPRRIDILIFRYLLARNILKNKNIKYKDNEIFSALEYMENDTYRVNTEIKPEVKQVVEMIFYS